MEWQDSGYSVEKLDLGIVSISVYWALVSKGEPTGYQYSFGNYKSKRLYPTKDEAKTAAINAVQVRLTQALKMLSTVSLPSEASS